MLALALAAAAPEPVVPSEALLLATPVGPSRYAADLEAGGFVAPGDIAVGAIERVRLSNPRWLTASHPERLPHHVFITLTSTRMSWGNRRLLILSRSGQHGDSFSSPQLATANWEFVGPDGCLESSAVAALKAGDAFGSAKADGTRCLQAEPAKAAH